MGLISQREFHLIDAKNKDINRYVQEIQASLDEKEIPKECKIDVFKSAVACCGYFPIGVSVEIEGARRAVIEDMDLMICSKIVEICEREGIEHECGPLEILAIEK